MTKADLIKHFSKHVEAKNKAVQLPKFFWAAKITKTDRKAIMDACEKVEKGQATTYMVDPSKALKVLNPTKKDA